MSGTGSPGQEFVDGSGVRQRVRQEPGPAFARLMLLVLVALVVVALGPVTSGPAGHGGDGAVHRVTGRPSALGALPAVDRPLSAPSVKPQPGPSDRGPANVRHGPPGQPLAETARAFGSSTLAADAADGSAGPPFPSRAWATRSRGAVRKALDAVDPRLGRAPPSYRVS